MGITEWVAVASFALALAEAAKDVCKWAAGRWRTRVGREQARRREMWRGVEAWRARRVRESRSS